MMNCEVTLKSGLRTLALLIGLITLFVNSSVAQCDEDKFVDGCALNLGDDYQYLRTFEAEEIEGSTNYPYTGAFLFRKGINYVFSMCEIGAGDEQITVNLYNRNRKLVASSFAEEGAKYYDKMIFKCSATGIFFVQTLMPLGADNCGITMLGFNAN